MAAPLGIAILGTGFMGLTHARQWLRLKESAAIRVVSHAPSEPTPGWVRRLGVPVEADWARAIDHPGVDVVDICLPTPLHLDAVRRAAACGRAILCEKPLSSSALDAESAIAAVRAAGVPFMVAHVVRFFPAYERAREAALSGEIGTPRSARTFRGGAPPAWARWYHDRSASGGPLLDLMVHDYDYLRWVFGDAERVFARSVKASPVRERSGECDHGFALLRFRSGAIAQVEGSWAYPPSAPFFTRFELAGTGGLIASDTRQERPFILWGAAAPDPGEQPAEPDPCDPYFREIAHFVEHVRDGAPLRLAPEDALEAVRIGEAALQSATEGRPVRLVGSHG